MCAELYVILLLLLSPLVQKVQTLKKNW